MRATRKLKVAPAGRMKNLPKGGAEGPTNLLALLMNREIGHKGQIES